MAGGKLRSKQWTFRLPGRPSEFLSAAEQAKLVAKAQELDELWSRDKLKAAEQRKQASKSKEKDTTGIWAPAPGMFCGFKPNYSRKGGVTRFHLKVGYYLSIDGRRRVCTKTVYRRKDLKAAWHSVTEDIAQLRGLEQVPKGWNRNIPSTKQLRANYEEVCKRWGAPETCVWPSFVLNRAL